MKINWIESALSSGRDRELIIKPQVEGSQLYFVARLEYTDLSYFAEETGNTPTEALEYLNDALLDEAATQSLKDYLARRSAKRLGNQSFSLNPSTFILHP